MLTPLGIYLRAVGIYLLVTLPVIVAPLMYVFSAFYVFTYGWFAWAMFTLISLVTRSIKIYHTRMLVLQVGVVASVAFAYHILGLFEPDLDVWNAGIFMGFPVAAVIAGWISLSISAKTILKECNKGKEDNIEFENPTSVTS